jgi:hypothetical protein
VELHDPASDVDQFQLSDLGGPRQSLECLQPGQIVSVHQNAFGLTDEIAAYQGRVQL